MQFPPLPPVRLTKIVCTLGPSSNTLDGICALAQAGMSVARVNLSHGSRDSHRTMVSTIRQAEERTGLPLPILFDTRGSEVRTGDVHQPIPIVAGEEVIFLPTSFKERPTGRTIIEVGYDAFAEDVRSATDILVDNGEMGFDLLRIEKDGTVLARARQAGSIGSRRHVNLPGANIDLPSITDHDWDDIAFGATLGVDFLALSFIRTADDVSSVRRFLHEKSSSIRIIAKIETAPAVANIADIIAVSDGIMVARGDLGAEIPFEYLPAVQDEIVVRCRDAGKPVIVATHMLESMTEHPIPTRAEVTDVASSALQRADASMLSGETASGKHPALVVSAMDRILRATEERLSRYTPASDVSVRTTMEESLQPLADAVHAAKPVAVLCHDSSGVLPVLVSKFRLSVPTIAVVATPEHRRLLHLHYGIFSVVGTSVEAGEAFLREKAIGVRGDRIVVMRDDRSIDVRTI